MALAGIKLDDGTGGFATNCFPVRTLVQQGDEAYGAWLVAHKAEQRRRFKAFVCSKPRSYDEIRGERKRAEKDGTAIVPPATDKVNEDDSKVLDGFFLMKHCCVEDPTDLCSVNVSGQGLGDIKEEDFPLFDNVAYVNASENILPFEAFNSFPIIRELEMSLNGLRSLRIQPTDFPLLEMLDLSFNNLSTDDVLALALIPNLKVLHLTGNNLRTLPPDMARPHLDEATFDKVPRFKNLEILLLDDNKLSDLSTFAALAGLRQLKHLSLSKNGIKSVPQLMLVEGKHITQDDIPLKKNRKSGRRSRASARRSKTTTPSKSADLMNSQQLEAEKLQKAASAGTVKSKDTVNASDAQLPAAGNPSMEKPGNPTVDIPGNPPVEIPTQGVQSDPALAQTSDADILREDPAERISFEDLDALSDLKLEELNLTELTTNVMESQTSVKPKMSHASTKISETGADNGDAFERDGYTGDAPLPPPFPMLRHLNLAHNKISEEESLLAVAAWPMLSELIIHDNPLTTQTSGDPPLLKRFLTERLGIKLCRKKPEPLTRPHIEVPVKTDRQIKSKIYPVPRCDVDKLLAIEAPPKSSPDTPGSSAQTPSQPQSQPLDRQQSFDTSKPLPPIAPSPIMEDEREEMTDSRAENAFFMTQIDEPSGARSRPPTVTQSTARSVATPQSTGRSEKAQSTQHRKAKKESSADQEKYKGYEALLDIDEDAEKDDMGAPKDLPGNIRALQYALTHPLVFRDNPSDLQVPQPPYRPYVKGQKMPPKKPRKTKTDKVEDALSNLKNRATVIEDDLKTVLQDKSKEFGNAEKLLRQVQRKYNSVRADSMKKSRDLQKSQALLRDTLKDVSVHRHAGKTTV